MTQHLLASRDEAEVLWFQRRGFLQAAAAWTAAGGFTAAQAQQRSNIVELMGEARLNGERLRPDATVQTGDQIETGPGAGLVFVVGSSAFRVRQNSRLSVERGATLNTVSLLRLITGGVASVWGRGVLRQVVTPTLTAGIRGTGVYAQADASGRSYVCNCYGVVDMQAGGERLRSQADYHQAFWGETQPVDGRLLRPAPAVDHTDEEI
ncbi:MAG TPA: iron dicitrate transport regulator FecR, partial [Ramlibacter sp.]|nr:iron dicitrate transport regulator FecR [Ramlibacter sp.]